MTQSSWSAIVAEVVEEMKTIADIGNVFDRRRLLTTEEDQEAFLISLSGEKRLRSWMVHLDAMDASFAEAGGTMAWDRQVVIEGFLQIEDKNATETAAIALAESIIRVLATDIRTTKLAGTVLAAQPPKMTANEPRIFGGWVVCHYLRLSMLVNTIETP